MRETTSLGAAIAAGFAVDVWKEFEDLKEINCENHTIFEPQIAPEASNKMFERWERAVEMSRGWLESEHSNQDK